MISIFADGRTSTLLSELQDFSYGTDVILAAKHELEHPMVVFGALESGTRKIKMLRVKVSGLPGLRRDQSCYTRQCI